MEIDIQKSLQIIKDFKPLENPSFNDINEDAYNYIVCSLYNRVCEAIKSFVVLIENKKYYDSFIIAGHCLETCAILSYIKDNSTIEISKERYCKYLASATLEKLKYNLELADNLEKELAWTNFCNLLNIFYPIGMNIIIKKEQAKEKHEEAIKQIKCRLGTNKEKISILKKYYLPIKTSTYIEALIKNTSYFGGEEFNKFYKKYCDIKHGNMMTPGAFFDYSPFIGFAKDGIGLILGIMYYLKDFKF